MATAPDMLRPARVNSSAWTGRAPRVWQQYRISTRLWAKVYVWARYRIIAGLCRATGGHHWSWERRRCEDCRIDEEWVQDWGHKPKLNAFLRCHAVVLNG